MHMCVHGSLDYTITNAYVRAWFSRLYYDKCICACMVLKIILWTNVNVRAWFSRLYYDKCYMCVHGSLDYILSQTHMYVHGSLDYTMTNAYVRAWFSRLYYDKCICTCMVLKIIL